ncbi:MAG: DUF58 domain-containing protein [Rhodospirillales bacterium]|nr:DUF58 domain-containing protein [Rhodospirillales bacterium]
MSEMRSGGLHHKAEELAAGLPPLLIAAERVAATVSQGVHGRRRVGQGETFWQFRRYQTGDSAADIDWRQSAKSQPVYVRENEWEAAQSVWLWRDVSPSMAYRSSNNLPTKSDRADILLLALASLLVRGGERMSLLGSGRPPATGRAVLTRMAQTIESTSLQEERPADSLPPFELLPRHGRLVLFGDFLSPLMETKAALDPYVGRGLTGHLVQILDPAEETLPFDGRVQFQGPEREGDVLIGKVEAVRADYIAALSRHRDGLAAMARGAGWTFTTHHTDHAPESILLSLFLALTQGRSW